MKTIGIIAEYNPFHNGHLYQINKIKEQTGATQIVVVMSGDFVQRGCPAWTDKYLRTQMALNAGADIVFELPVCFATASAEAFALAGVSLLSSLDFVDGICFGSEHGDLSLLKAIASFLLNPTESFHSEIKELTAQGFSYPTARQKALIKHFSTNIKIADNITPVLASPNNILAIEYLKAIQQFNSSLVPYTIKRSDSGYHSDTLDTCFASATAIRKQSLTNNNIATNVDVSGSHSINTLNKERFFNQVKDVLPKAVLSILRDKKSHFPITENDFSDLLFYRLEQLSESDLSILDMTPELYHRIKNCMADFNNYSDFAATLKTKQYTYSRISRVLLHLLLDIRLDNSFSMPVASSHLPFVPYARLLGFSKAASSLLRHETNIPIVTKPADGQEQIIRFYSPIEDTKEYIEYAQKLYQKDIFAANLYTQVQNTKCNLSLPNEYHQKPVII